jgi:hypothetical protein
VISQTLDFYFTSPLVGKVTWHLLFEHSRDERENSTGKKSIIGDFRSWHTFKKDLFSY